MSTIFGLSIGRARARIAILALAFGLFEFLVALSYAAVDQNVVRELYESLPPALRAFAGAADVASPAGYLGSAYIHPIPLVIQGALAISMATAAARDLEDGSAELILSRPLRRWHWLAAQAAAMGVAATIVAVGGFVGGAIGATTVADLAPVSIGGLAIVSAGGLLLTLAIGAVALAASAGLRGGGRAVGWAAGFAVVSYALNYLAEIWRLIAPLGRVSVYWYYDPGVILTRTEMSISSVLALAAVTIIAGVAALVLIERREAF